MICQLTPQRKSSHVCLLKNPGMSSCINIHSTEIRRDGGEVKMAACSELPSLSPDSSSQPPSSPLFQSIHRSVTLRLRTGFPPPLHSAFVHGSSLPPFTHLFPNIHEDKTRTGPGVSLNKMLWSRAFYEIVETQNTYLKHWKN